MNQDNQRDRVAAEGDKDDRISGLPKHVIDHILEHLPIHDAARTCVLSKSWRYSWTMLPNLVLNRRNHPFTFKEAIDKILLLHIGNIVKFVLDVREVDLVSYPDTDVDRWVLYVTRNDVKKLSLKFTYVMTDMYKLPHCIFNCSTLTHLDLFGCVFKPPTSFLGFQSLVALRLKCIIFVPTSEFCVIKAPLLAKLTLSFCHGMECLNIISSRLKYLYVFGTPLVLDCFMDYKNLKAFELEFHSVVDISDHDKRSALEKFLASSPELDVLHLNSCSVELLSAGIIPNGLPFTLNWLQRLSLFVDFSNLVLTSYALQLIKSSPCLIKLQIWVEATSDNAEAISKYLETQDCLEQPLDKLKFVVIKEFESSKCELLFVKLLLSRTPSLLRMCIEQQKGIGTSTEGILLGLLRFPRASPKAELCYFPCPD